MNPSGKAGQQGQGNTHRGRRSAGRRAAPRHPAARCREGHSQDDPAGRAASRRAPARNPLSDVLGMSRTPIREAFRTLAAEGLIDLLPNRSVVVSMPDKSEAADVFAVLGVLESLAGQLACRRMSRAQMEIPR